jgi:hypothetical protein
VPGRIRYDNLKPAVTRMLIGRDRVENERFIALRSHYLFDSFFCLPGIEGAHEKGGVEGEVGRFRRWHLVPVPDVADLAELNTYVRQRLQVDDRRRVTGRAATIGETFETVERAALKPLPDERFDTMRSLSAKVDAKARVCVLQAHYSVPASYAGRRVQVKLGARHLEVIDPSRGAIIAVWDRSLKKFTQHYELDHYLEILLRKPGAMPGSSALAQARARGVFTELHQRFWDTARTTKGDAEGTRRLCEVLLLARRMPADQLTAGIAAALQVGSTDPAVVAVEARRHAGGGTSSHSRSLRQQTRRSGPPSTVPHPRSSTTTPCSRCPHDHNHPDVGRRSTDLDRDRRQGPVAAHRPHPSRCPGGCCCPRRSHPPGLPRRAARRRGRRPPDPPP